MAIPSRVEPREGPTSASDMTVSKWAGARREVHAQNSRETVVGRTGRETALWETETLPWFLGSQRKPFVLGASRPKRRGRATPILTGVSTPRHLTRCTLLDHRSSERERVAKQPDERNITRREVQKAADAPLLYHLPSYRF
jgi:hypothetical protein